MKWLLEQAWRVFGPAVRFLWFDRRAGIAFLLSPLVLGALWLTYTTMEERLREVRAAAESAEASRRAEIAQLAIEEERRLTAKQRSDDLAAKQAACDSAGGRILTSEQLGAILGPLDPFSVVADRFTIQSSGVGPFWVSGENGCYRFPEGFEKFARLCADEYRGRVTAGSTAYYCSPRDYQKAQRPFPSFPLPAQYQKAN